MRKHCALPSSSKYALHSKAMFILDWLFIYPYILNFQGRCRIMLIHGVQSKHHQMSWASWNFEANGDLLALAASQRDSQCLILGPRGIPGGTEAYRWGTSRYPLFQHVSTYIYLVHPGPHFFLFPGYPTSATYMIVPAGFWCHAAEPFDQQRFPGWWYNVAKSWSHHPGWWMKRSQFDSFCGMSLHLPTSSDFFLYLS